MRTTDAIDPFTWPTRPSFASRGKEHLGAISFTDIVTFEANHRGASFF